MRKWAVAFVMLAFLSGLAVAQEKAAKKPAEKKISGQIVGIDEAKSTVLIKKGNDQYTVTFNATTKWTKQVANKRSVDAERSEFKTGTKVICAATADEKGHWVANRIDLVPPPK